MVRGRRSGSSSRRGIRGRALVPASGMYIFLITSSAVYFSLYIIYVYLCSVNAIKIVTVSASPSSERTPPLPSGLGMYISIFKYFFSHYLHILLMLLELLQLLVLLLHLLACLQVCIFQFPSIFVVIIYIYY